MSAPDHSDGSQYPLPARQSVSVGRMQPHRARRAPHANEGGDNTISHTFLLWVLKQWWPIVVPTGIVLAILAAALVMYFHVPEYEAQALLMIEDASPFIAFQGREANVESKRYVQTQLELLRSPVVLEPALARSEIASLEELSSEPDAVNYLRRGVSITQVGQSELYNIGYTSDKPEAAATVVNGIIAEYMNIHAGDEFQRSQRVIDILEEERRRRGLEVDRLRKRVVELAKEVTGRDPFGGNDMPDIHGVRSPVGSLFQSLTEVDVEREILQAQLQSLLDVPSLAATTQPAGLIDLEIDSHPDVRARQQAITDIQGRLEQIKQYTIRFHQDPQWETDPTYVALKKELERREEDLNSVKATLRQVVLTERKHKQKNAYAQQIASMQRDLDVLEKRKEILSKRLDEQVGEMRTGGAKSVELEFAKAELQREERVFELIASRKLALQTELRAPWRIQLRQKANVPSVPVEPVPYKLLLLACAGALVAPFGLAFLREITVRRISDVEQLAYESQLRVLGEVAALPVRYVAVNPHQLSGRLRRETYVFAESINSLRTNLALAEGESMSQVLTVTSASSGEGKTSVAVSLAMSISNATEQPTLIIDGDMRSPSVATMLKAKSQPGLFEVLSKKCQLDDAIQPVTGNPSLYVIAAGRATRSTHSVLAIAELKQLLDQLRGRFSAIIIDTPPILGASESLVLSRAADAVLFCALSDVSRSKQVRIAIDRLEHAHVNVAGAVLSGTPARQYEHVYGYYANRIETVN